jgi:putative hydrolase of the HAD superfamily
MYDMMDRKISGVFFDFGGTLFDYYPANAVIWARIAKRLGVDVLPDATQIRQGMRRQNEAFVQLGKTFGQLSRDELHELNCHVLNAIGIDGKGTMQVISEEFEKREQGKMFQIYPDCKDTLDKIEQKGLKIGLISNVGERLAKIRRSTMQEHGILHYFSTVILSVEVGAAKPSKAIFDIALHELGIEDPGEALHVGDSYIADVKGAQNAGLIPVLFDPLEFHSGGNVIKIKTLSDILQHLK